MVQSDTATGPDHHPLGVIHIWISGRAAVHNDDAAEPYASPQQQPQHRDLAGGRRGHQRAAAALPREARVGASLQQQPRHLQAAG